MSDVSVDPQAVIHKLGTQIGGLVTELAVREAMLEAANARIEELLAERPAENTTPDLNS